jgi:hypothetical protein
MKKIHDIKNVTITKDRLELKVDGRVITADLKKISKRLFNAKKNERESYEISPSGYGIHWRLIDEDISVDALLGNKHETTAVNK